jgi:hypothetical protein
MSEIVPIIDASVQSKPKGMQEASGSSIAFLFYNLAHDGALISPWWSVTRDLNLRALWKKVDYVSGAVYALSSFMTTVPFKIEPRDKAIRAHNVMADKYQEMLENGSEWSEGWEAFYSKWIEDLNTQDNGAFFEVVGAGDPTGPIMGMPLSIAHFDAARCRRTGNPEFPVVYSARDGTRHKMHYTRIGFTSQMTSPVEDMLGVGFCSVSRAVNIAINMYDMLIYKQEKLGSRPLRTILVAQGGLDPEHIQEALDIAGENMDSQGLSRYSKIPMVGDSAAENAAIQQIDLASLPDGFDEQTSITLGMATIALAFGVDARELFPAMSSGATKADALLAHVKSRGKAKGQTLELTKRLFEQKVLPPTLKMTFDFQDDVQDQQVAELKLVRSERHTIDLSSEAIDIRTAREQMFSDGDLTREQFVRLEMEDGRLEDGISILTLFSTKEYLDHLNLGVPNPINLEANESEVMIDIIKDRISELTVDLGTEGNSNTRRRITESIFALKFLMSEYEGDGDELQESEEFPGETLVGGAMADDELVPAMTVEEEVKQSPF